MQQQLTCNQVMSLLSYYIENKLNKQLSKDIEYHLRICPNCNRKFKKMTNLMNNFSDVAKKISEDSNINEDEILNNKRYIEFKTKLSAYIDNELDDDENLRMKKYTISNPIARKDLENIYAYKKLINASFSKTKNEIKNDYSRNILNEIYSMNTNHKLDPFYLLMILFTIIISITLLGVAHFFPL